MTTRNSTIARQTRIDVAGLAQHVIQRGVNRSACFVADIDRQYYLTTLQKVAHSNHCRIHAYVLMTNHVHMLITGGQPGSISRMMQALGRRYVQYFNTRHQRTGTLWEGRFKSSLVDSDRYLLQCYRYIERNPVRANMVQRAEDYWWSSARANAHGKRDSVVSPHSAYLNLGKDRHARLKNYRALLCTSGTATEVSNIRAHINQGKVLGTPQFLRQIEKRVGRSVALQPKGRPKSEEN